MKKIFIREYTDGFVYCLHDIHNNICRIGKTDKKANNRIQSQLSYYPFELIITKIAVKNITECETYLHRHFRPKKLKSDWYNINTEEFKVVIMKYKRLNKGQIHYKLVLDWDISLHNRPMTNKRRAVNKKDNL